MHFLKLLKDVHLIFPTSHIFLITSMLMEKGREKIKTRDILYNDRSVKNLENVHAGVCSM